MEIYPRYVSPDKKESIHRECRIADGLEHEIPLRDCSQCLVLCKA